MFYITSILTQSLHGPRDAAPVDLCGHDQQGQRQLELIIVLTRAQSCHDKKTTALIHLRVSSFTSKEYGRFIKIVSRMRVSTVTY